MRTFLALSVAVSGTLVVVHLAVYPLLIRILAGRRSAVRPAPEEAPDEPVTIVIPACNEARTLRRKVANIAASAYPSRLVRTIVVSNGSTDDTDRIAGDLPVTLLHSGPGKIAALNAGIREAASDVIICTDADVLIGPDAIGECVARLGGDVGAVCAAVAVEPSGAFYSRGKQGYHRRDWELRRLEGIADSAASLDGKLLAFRKSVYPGFPDGAPNDDYEIVFDMKRLGLRSVVLEGTVVVESPPAGLREELRQIRRRVGCGIVTNVRRAGFLFNPRHGAFGLLIFPLRRFLPFLFPFLALLVGALSIASHGAAGAAAVLVATAAIACGSPYVAIQFVGVSLAWVDVLCGRIARGGVWRKIETVR